jgi:hypothetical protein
MREAKGASDQEIVWIRDGSVDFVNSVKNVFDAVTTGCVW